DYGGITPFGQAVRQFTQQYDRGYWLGDSRTADEGYDLFAFAMICLQLTDPVQELQKGHGQDRNIDTLLSILERCWLPIEAKYIVRNLMNKKIQSTSEACSRWRKMMMSHPRLETFNPPSP